MLGCDTSEIVLLTLWRQTRRGIMVR